VTADAEAGDESSIQPVLLVEPRDGTPEPLVTREGLAAAAEGLAAGHGPVAVDAERASGYRYGQRAYLIQLRRAGYGTVLIDPIALPDLTSIDAALADAEWILHAANQDLPCLAEVGMRPRRLFDSELVGRLLGSERVSLSTMLEQHLSIRLEKGHSAADWSTRPLPKSWLVYAALDVELLIELRAVLVAELDRTGKREWAEQEFQAVLQAPPPPPRVDPWRRTSGIHGVRNRRQLAMIRALWEARDQLAARRDIAPGRVLPDAAIIGAVRANPLTIDALIALPVFGGHRQQRSAPYWLEALEAGRAVPESELPPVALMPTDPDAIPSPSRWREKDALAAARLVACREVVALNAEKHQVVVHNLLAGEIVRRLAWTSVTPLSVTAVRARMAELGARPWQIDLLAAELTEALDTTLPEPPQEPQAPAND